MTTHTDYANLKMPYTYSCEKGNITEKEDSICFEGRGTSAKIEKLIYERGSLELTVFEDVGTDRINDSVFCNVGLDQQLWVGQTTVINKKDIPSALDGLQNQSHITNEFAQKVLQRLK